MLSTIKLVNFKSFIENDLPIRKLTLLAGLNNCGKSSVFQALRMMRKFAYTGDPSLSGHGQLKDMKNSKTSKSSDTIIRCIFDSLDEIGINISFNDLDKPQITSKTSIGSRLELLSYLSADRLGPRVSLPLNTTTDYLCNVGEQGEYVIDYIHRHERDIVPVKLRHHLSEGDTLEYNIRGWLREISPNVVFNHGVDQRRDSSYAEINNYRPTNTGYGLSYSLPIITLLLGMASTWDDKCAEDLKVANGALVLLENPEAHLHPKGQTAMGRLIALAAASGVQIIVETHSDHLMDGIRIAIKENELLVADTIFHYFNLVDGATQVQTPEIYQNGKLSFWPEGFFDQTMINRAILAKA